MIWIFPIIAVFTLSGLLYGEKRESQQQKWIFKPLTSLLFLLVGLAAGLDDTYSRILFAGLFLCFWGDVFLIPHSNKWFLAGLVTFLSGHVAYIATFNYLVSFTELSPIILLLIALFSGGIYFWLRPKLGEMGIPVLAYVIVITVMVWSAWSVYFESNEGETFRYLVAFGATAFYFSDLSVAIDRFVNPNFTNRLWGLPLYYLGQFLLAFSIYYH